VPAFWCVRKNQLKLERGILWDRDMVEGGDGLAGLAGGVEPAGGGGDGAADGVAAADDAVLVLNKD
jgi:hypothetical protein